MKTLCAAAVVAGALISSGVISLPIIAFGDAPSKSTAARGDRAAALAPLIAGDYLVAAPGRVEPASEEIRIGVPITAVLKRVAVHEGDRVSRGQLLAELDNADYAAALAKADADLKLAQAEFDRVVNGALPAARAAALANVQEMEAVEKNAAATLERRRSLRAHGAVSQESFDEAQRAYDVAQQQHKAALEKYALINDPARQEDVAVAQARVAAAQAARDEAQAVYDKTLIKSPIDGTVLRINRHAGELLSVFVDQPIMTLGDLSTLNVRAEVDEADIAKLQTGLPAYVTADAYGNQHFAGHVIRVGEMLGEKVIHTDQPTERPDAKVLDVLVALDSPNPLKPGLRVNTFITRQQVSKLGPRSE